MDREDQYWRRPTVSSIGSEPRALRTITSPVQAGHDRSNWIAKCARAILSSYRRDDFADPDNYLIQLGAVLERYPDAVIKEATAPASGIQRQCKFPPSIAEVVDFCDDLARRQNYGKDFDSRTGEQLKDRDAVEESHSRESTEYRINVIKRIKEEIAKATPRPDSYEAMFAKYGKPIGAFEEGRERPYGIKSK